MYLMNKVQFGRQKPNQADRYVFSDYEIDNFIGESMLGSSTKIYTVENLICGIYVQTHCSHRSINAVIHKYPI